jgi:hypothetical protein
MGWYHSQLAAGSDPFTDDAELNSDCGCSTLDTTTTASAATSPTASPPMSQFGFLETTPEATRGGSLPSLDYDSMTCIYHLCREKNWKDAVDSSKPYYPPTFVADGRFTRASESSGASLVETANTYYSQASPKEEQWIVLEINAQLLLSMGIQILPQCAPETSPSTGEPVSCLQVFGGISTSTPNLILSVYRIQRESKSGVFTSIDSSVSLGRLLPRRDFVSGSSDEASKPFVETLQTPEQPALATKTAVDASKMGIRKTFGSKIFGRSKAQ